MKAAKSDINGIFLLNKPLEISSNQALQRVKKIFNAKKAGHTGSLDPLATGMLPICFGRATRFCQYLLDADKTYFFSCQLGKRTTTGDAEGEVVSTRAIPSLTESELDSVLDQFRGDILQVPSMYSALKHNGKPLYEYARQGIEIDRPARRLHISSLQILSFDHDTISCEVRCSKGTYIRSLVDDIGEALGCGAFVTHLHRSSVAGFDASRMISFEELESKWDSNGGLCNKLLVPISESVCHLPIVRISDVDARLILQTGRLKVSGKESGKLFSIYHDNGDFIGVARSSDDGMLLKLQTRL